LAADARLAVLHLAPFAESIDDTAVNIEANGMSLFENVKFKDFVDYTEVAAGEYTIDIIPVGASDPAISATVTLEDNKDYSAIAVGNGTTQDLQLLAVEDSGNVPTDSNNVAIRVFHTAPFAADLAATEVSIRTAGGDVVNGLVGVPFGVNSGFFEIPAGEYDLKVASNDGSVNLIDPLPAVLPAGAGVTVYAIGDGINQPLGILAFPVGELQTRTPVDNSASGTWVVMEGSGTGYYFMPIPAQNRVVGMWFTYDMDGNPTFLTFQSEPGAFDGEMATTALYASSGGGNSEDDVVETVQVGEIDFELVDCDNAMATVRLDGEDPAEFTAVNLASIFCEDSQ
jgi:hypothetical protein